MNNFLTFGKVFVLVSIFVFSGSALAATSVSGSATQTVITPVTIQATSVEDTTLLINCDGQAKPAISCPNGYSIGCNPTGGYHWGCMKDASAVLPTITGTTEPQKGQTDALLEIDTIKGESSEKKKGNVEVNWKVEEGESVASDDGEPITPDFGILLGGSGESRTQASTDYLLKLGGVDGESTKNESASVPKEIVIQGVVVRGWDPKTKEEIVGTAPKTIEEVQNNDDLALFMTAVLDSDPQMEEVAFNFEKITIKYRSNGKLFGFIPMSFIQEVLVDTSEGSEPGNVKVRMPWFSFLMKSDVSPGEIEEETKKKEKSIQIESWSFGASQTGQAFSMISNVLKTKHDTVKNSIGNVR